MSERSTESIASFLDKTDWREVIQESMESAVNAIGTILFPHKVEILITTVGCTYPGFDAEQEIQNKRSRLESKYTEVEKLWLKINPTRRRDQKWIYHIYLKHCLSYDLLTFIKNLCARKRMLLVGTTKTKAVGYDELRKHFANEPTRRH